MVQASLSETDNVFCRVQLLFAQSAGAVEYTDCTSAEG